MVVPTLVYRGASKLNLDRRVLVETNLVMLRPQKLTVEVFLLTVRLFYLRWANRKQKRPNPISLSSGGGGTVSKKDQT